MATPTTRTRRAGRDTGFPEPFDAYRNTTLPHPEADISGNACITHDESAGDVLAQLRRRPTSLLHRAKTRRAAGDTILESPAEVFAAAVAVAAVARPESRSRPGSVFGSSGQDATRMASTRSSSVSLSLRDDGESMLGRDEDGTPPTSPESVRSARRNVFGISKWKR